MIHRGIKSLVHIVVSKSVDGPNHNLEAEEVATSTHFMALKVIGDFHLLMLFVSPVNCFVLL